MNTPTRAAIHLHRPRLTLWTGADVKADRVDLTEAALSFQVSKSLEAPAGSWSVNLLTQGSLRTRTTAWRQILDLYTRNLSNAPVSIGIDQPGGIMLGLVSGKAQQLGRRGFSGPASSTLSLSGQDLGKVFTQDNVIRGGLNLTSEKSSAYLTGIKNALGEESPFYHSFLDVLGPVNRYDPDAAPTFQGQSVLDVVTWILASVGSMRIPLLGRAYGGDGRLSSYIRTTDCVTSGDADRVWNDGLSTFQGSVWSFLQQVLDPDLYEMRIDSKPVGTDGVPLPHLVIRPRPFDEPRWAALNAGDAYGITWNELRTFVEKRANHTITDAEILDASFNVSDAEVYNHYTVIAKHELIGNQEANNRGLSYPATDTGSVRIFGARAMQAHLGLVGGDVAAAQAKNPDYTGELARQVREQRNRLLNWHRFQPFFESATVTVPGRDEYRPGDPVLLADRPAHLASSKDRDTGADLGMRYYCTAVSWRYSPAGGYESTLTLERGHNDALLREASRILDASGPVVES